MGHAFVSVRVDEAVTGVTENTLETQCGACVLMAVVRQVSSLNKAREGRSVKLKAASQ